VIFLLNEYTTPLMGKLSYYNVGIIKAISKFGDKINVGKIEYQHFDDESYQ